MFFEDFNIKSHKFINCLTTTTIILTRLWGKCMREMGHIREV